LSSNSSLRSMAELLRSGAKLTDLSCPACSSPLFRMGSGDLWCAQCQKKVVVVKEGEQIEDVKSFPALGTVESVLVEKIQQTSERIRGEIDIRELRRLNVVLASLLDNLEKVRKTGRSRT